MGNVHLVTGFAGKPHVTAADHASLFEAAFRSGQFVMNSGNNFKASLISANQVRISDGEMIMQGRFVRINPAAYEDVAIENGAQGYLRNDLIVMRYTRDADTGIESIGLVAIKGQAVAADPADPQHQVGDINDGGNLVNDFPLYRIPLDGLNVGDPIALFTLQPSIYDLYAAYKAATDKSLSQLSADKAPAGYGLGSTNGKVVTDANNATNNGWYTIYNGGSNLPGSSYGGAIHVKAYPTNNIIQHLYYTGHGGGECRRICTDGTWGEWEFVTPPLYAGVEYRTTERYDGKAVYTKLLDCGTITNGKAVNHGAGSGLIRMAPVCSGILSTTIKDQSDDWAWVVSADQTAVRMTCGSGIAGNARWKTQIWYTKD